MFYWLLEYGKILAVYLIIMYLWPSVVFHKYLSNKDGFFRFAFCITSMILLLNTAVLMLGITKLLNKWIVRILFYGPVAYIAAMYLYRNRGKAVHIHYLLTGICSPKRFVGTALKRVWSAFKNACKGFRRSLGADFVPCMILLVLIAYGMIYFSYGAFDQKYYGASDMYVHHNWLDMMLEGTVFGAGIYPAGMHCFVYAMHTLFGVEVYNCMLFLAGIHISAFLVAAYLFLKEIFVWKFSGVLVLTLFLILRLDSAAQIGSIARLQWTIPQEFGLFSAFLCGTYLLRFLRQPQLTRAQWKNRTFVRDENLLIFLLALAVSVAVHFYVTIMAFFLCAAIGIFFLFRVFTRKQFLPLLLSILCGLTLAVTPMLIARATGIQFQSSIDWAMSVIEESQEAIEKADDPFAGTEAEIYTDSPHWEIDTSLLPNEFLAGGEYIVEPEKGFLTEFYENSFAVLYSTGRAALFTVLVLLGGILGLLVHIIARIKCKKGVGEDPFCGYLFLTAAVLVFMLLFAAPNIGIVEIILIDRLGSLVHFLTLAAITIPLDLVMSFIAGRNRDAVMNLCATVLCAAICVAVVATGNYHSYLFYYISRYPAAVDITAKITQGLDPKSYTIVASFDELYHVKEAGLHEEAVRFVHEMYEESYTLPTEYVFIYLEKQPLSYSHNHLLNGPAWLANEDYLELMEDPASQAPDILHSDISDESAAKDIALPVSYDSYMNLDRRTVVYSRLNQWIARFNELYPYQLTKAYEDDAFVCYMFRQNPARLLELAIMNE